MQQGRPDDPADGAGHEASRCVHQCSLPWRRRGLGQPWMRGMRTVKVDPSPRLEVDRQRAAHELDHVLGYRQAKAGARLVGAAVAAKKRSKTRSSSSWGMPGPWSVTVITTSSSPFGVGSAREPTLTAAVLGRELHGVVEQGPQHLAHAALVAGGRQLGRRRHVDAHAAAFGARPELGGDGAREARDVGVAGLETNRARVDLREVEQAERQVGQPVDLLAHERQELLLGRPGRGRPRRSAP